VCGGPTHPLPPHHCIVPTAGNLRTSPRMHGVHRIMVSEGRSRGAQQPAGDVPAAAIDYSCYLDHGGDIWKTNYREGDFVHTSVSALARCFAVVGSLLHR
jgi:hypothetical protein